jgi:hypothetical protein
LGALGKGKLFWLFSTWLFDGKNQTPITVRLALPNAVKQNNQKKVNFFPCISIGYIFFIKKHSFETLFTD